MPSMYVQVDYRRKDQRPRTYASAKKLSKDCYYVLGHTSGYLCSINIHIRICKGVSTGLGKGICGPANALITILRGMVDDACKTCKVDPNYCHRLMSEIMDRVNSILMKLK